MKPILSRRLLFILFTASGFSGLIYESIWSHYLKLFLGHAAYAQTLVLTVFMGGMAAGAWLAARFSPRLGNLLLTYALVEIVTGTIALGFHPLYLGAVDFTFDSIIPALDAPFAINFTKWLIAALLILPQSMLLGATFPLISGGVMRRFPQAPGATLAMLYFTNSLGAALGVLASGFWLIELVGLPGTVTIAGIINVLLGVTIWLLRGTEPAPASGSPTPSAGEPSHFARRMLIVAFLSGTAAFIYEIAWIRMLSMVLGSSTHAFELMLSAFILGLALGGLVIRRRIDTLANPRATLAIMFGVMAMLATLTLPAYGMTFDLVSIAMRGLSPTDSGYAAFNLVSHAIAAVVMIPTTFVAGMTLPVITHALLKRADERAIGRVYAANTVGAIAGVLVAVHVLLPAVGLKGAIIAGAAIQLITCLLLVPRPLARTGSTASRTVFAGAVALLLIAGFFVHLDPMRMASGVYRRGMARLPGNASVIFMRDGKTATISLVRQGDAVAIATNGKPDAALDIGTSGASAPDELTMTLAAALPLAIHPDPRDVANIGFGSGLTSHVVLGSRSVERLDSIEIEPVMVQAARFGFGARVSRVFDDPRSHVHYEDAKTFFSAARRQYDLIISEPSNPWVSGVATLFSTEFYSQIRRNLKPKGLLVQWIQIYETDITIVSSILQAMSPHFADYVVYSANDSDIIIVASPTGRVPAISNDLFATPELAKELTRTGLLEMGDLEIRRIGDRHLLDPLMTRLAVPANSDFYPYVDLNAPRLRFLSRDALDLVRLSHLAVPLAEIYGQPLPSAASDSAASAKYLYRHALARDAQAALRAVAASDAAVAPEDLRASVLAFTSAGSCADEATRQAWLTATYTLATRTTPFVPLDARAGLWRSARASACIPLLAPAEKNWFDLLAATASDDREGMARHGEQFFLEPPPHLDGKQLLEALLTTVSAQTVTGKAGEARELLQAMLPMLQNAGQYSLALKLVDAQALNAIP
jgi:spermidine synthase